MIVSEVVQAPFTQFVAVRSFDSHFTPRASPSCSLQSSLKTPRIVRKMSTFLFVQLNLTMSSNPVSTSATFPSSVGWPVCGRASTLRTCPSNSIIFVLVKPPNDLSLVRAWEGADTGDFVICDCVFRVWPPRAELAVLPPKDFVPPRDCRPPVVRPAAALVRSVKAVFLRDLKAFTVPTALVIKIKVRFWPLGVEDVDLTVFVNKQNRLVQRCSKGSYL